LGIDVQRPYKAVGDVELGDTKGLVESEELKYIFQIAHMILKYTPRGAAADHLFLLNQDFNIEIFKVKILMISH
jgi:hypothetical protein